MATTGGRPAAGVPSQWQPLGVEQPLEEDGTQIALSGIGQHDHDGLATILRTLGQSDRDGGGRSAGDAGEDALLLRQAAGVQDGILIAYLLDGSCVGRA